MSGQPKVYSGNRSSFTTLVEVRERGAMLARPLGVRLDLFNHSPTGFEWGFGGSSPAQLALAIIADHLGGRAPAPGLQMVRRRQVRLACLLLSSGAIDRCLSERVLVLTDVPTIERGTYFVIRTDGSEDVRTPPRLDDMRRARSAPTHSTRSWSLRVADGPTW